MQIPCVYIPGPAPAVSVANINSVAWETEGILLHLLMTYIFNSNIFWKGFWVFCFQNMRWNFFLVRKLNYGIGWILLVWPVCYEIELLAGPVCSCCSAWGWRAPRPGQCGGSLAGLSPPSRSRRIAAGCRLEIKFFCKVPGVKPYS